MSSEPLFGLDSVIHPVRRLAICAYLVELAEAEFAALRGGLRISDSSLSKHLSTLRDAGYVHVDKRRDGGYIRTWVSLTASGRAAYDAHVRALRQMTGT